jgi:cell division protein FtsA
MHDVSIERGQLNRIIRNSLAAMLLQVRDRIPADMLKSGMDIYLSGGTSLMRGLDGLCRYIFGGVPVHQPAPLQPGHNHSYLADPRYCTAIGLIRYAQRFDEDAIIPRRKGWLPSILRMFGFGR